MPIVRPSFPLLARSHPLAQGLVGAWPFHEGSGLSVYDLSGREHTGTLHTGVTWSSQESGYTISMDGGTNTNASLAVGAVNAALGSTTGWTLVAKVYYKGNPAGNFGGLPFQWIIDSASKNGGLLGISSTGVVQTGARSKTTDAFASKTSSRAALSLNTWHLLAGLCDYAGGTLNIGIDGVLESTSAVTFGSTTYVGGTPTNNDVFGDATSIGNKGAVNGFVDVVLLYNRVLSAVEVAQLAYDPWQIFRRRSWRLKAAVAGAYLPWDTPHSPQHQAVVAQ